jgi:hypothetical protein
MARGESATRPQDARPAEKELAACSNCGRILYYTRDMDLAVVDWNCARVTGK